MSIITQIKAFYVDETILKRFDSSSTNRSLSMRQAVQNAHKKPATLLNPLKRRLEAFDTSKEFTGKTKRVTLSWNESDEKLLAELVNAAQLSRDTVLSLAMDEYSATLSVLNSKKESNATDRDLQHAGEG
jgi:6-phosphogluconolactonase/glucosamine-6-phosphate isomerase/deaminase